MLRPGPPGNFPGVSKGIRFLLKACQYLQKHSTGGSRVIPQHSTNPAQTRLTSEIGRDRVLSGWYDRAIHIQISRGICPALDRCSLKSEWRIRNVQPALPKSARSSHCRLETLLSCRILRPTCFSLVERKVWVRRPGCYPSGPCENCVLLRVCLDKEPLP